MTSRTSISVEKFIAKAKAVHEDLYDYSKSIYVNFKTPVTIICPIHGEFQKLPTVHVSGKQGCPTCGYQRAGINSRMSVKEFLDSVKAKHGDRYDYSKTQYTGIKNKIIIGCQIHGEFEQIANDHQNGSGCPQCTHSYKLDTNTWIIKAKNIHGLVYDYSKSIYTGAHKPIIVGCSIHGDFSISAKSHTVNQKGCPNCSWKNSTRGRLDHNEWIKQAIEIHSDVYDYSSTAYTRMVDDVTITCKIHGEFIQRAQDHILGRGCPKCGMQKVTTALRYTTDDFIRLATVKHQAKYTYTNDYVNGKSLVTIICPVHGKFKQTAGSHLAGAGCAACCGTKKHTNDTFVLAARAVHKDRYGYDRVVYQSNKIPITITCIQHGDFQQQPGNHLSGAGCPICANISIGIKSRLGSDKFVERARGIHKDTYTYDKTIYTNMSKKIIITCPKHGDFEQRPNDHLNGSGCPTCGMKLSKAENEINQLLMNLGIVIESRRRDIIKPKELDLYLPEHKIAIEYCGLYWHSEQFNQDKNYHLDKQQRCDALGIRLITIFEDEWKHKQDIVKAFLVHLVGKSPKGDSGRHCTIRSVPWSIAKPFLDLHHLQASGRAGSNSIGAYDRRDQLVAVMTFGSPSDERGNTDEVEMKRFVTDKHTHPGLGSKMMKFAAAEFGFTRVMAFVDRRWFTGEFKEHSGFIPAYTTEPGFYWTDGLTRIHRRSETKASLIKKHHFDSAMTKVVMMELLGFYRIWDCGKIKMIWSKSHL